MLRPFAVISPAITTMFCAILADAASMSRPSSDAAPRPCDSASVSASRIRFALAHFLGRRREDLVREIDLRRVNRPLPLAAERRGASRGELESIRILEVAERSVDRAESVRAAGDDHPRDAEVPLVAGIIGIQPADVRRARAHARGVVGDAEVHRLEPLARLRDRLDVRHAERGLDEHLDADLARELLRILDLCEQRIDHVHVARERRPSESAPCRRTAPPAR